MKCRVHRTDALTHARARTHGGQAENIMPPPLLMGGCTQILTDFKINVVFALFNTSTPTAGFMTKSPAD